MKILANYLGYYESPIGWIETRGTEKAILTLDFIDEPGLDPITNPCISAALSQIAEYFQGARRNFDLPLDLQGTDFQRKVWGHLTQIPFGQVVTYREVAERIGRPKAVRAVGASNGRNPISIIVPCHRGIGSDGKLTGYGGGLWRKEWLLKHEGILTF